MLAAVNERVRKAKVRIAKLGKLQRKAVLWHWQSVVQGQAVTVSKMMVRQPASGHVRATYMLAGAVRSRRCSVRRALPNLEHALELI